MQFDNANGGPKEKRGTCQTSLYQDLLPRICEVREGFFVLTYDNSVGSSAGTAHVRRGRQPNLFGFDADAVSDEVHVVMLMLTGVEPARTNGERV